MIRVNLLPFRAARKKENIKRQVSIYVVALFLFVTGLVWYNFSLGNKTERMQKRISSTEKELETYRQINNEIGEIKKKLAVLKAKTGVIEELESNRREPVLMLDSMTDIVVPKRMWFKSLRIKEKIVNKEPAKRGKRGKKVKKKRETAPPEKVVDVSINGIALDNKTVADFMTRLEKSSLYSNVNLKTLQQVTIRKVNLKEFVITFNRNQPKKEEAKAEKKTVKS